MNIEARMILAERCFKEWKSEQDMTIPKYHVQVERFFSRHIYSEIEDLRHIDSSYLGELMKQLIKLSESEVERAFQVSQQ